MTQQSRDKDFSDLTILTALLLWMAGGGMLALSHLFDMRWFMGLLVVLVLSGVLIAVATPLPAVGLFGLSAYGVLALYGFVTMFGELATAIITVTAAGLTYGLIRARRVDTAVPKRAPVRPAAPRPILEKVSDQTLMRWAREHLASGGERSTGAVVDGMVRRLNREQFDLRPPQDLWRIAETVLAGPTTPPPPSTPRRDLLPPEALHITERPPLPRPIPRPPLPPSPESSTPKARPADVRRARQASPRTRSDSRKHLHEFGSFEIERIVAERLAVEPQVDDDGLVEHVLERLGISDRSTFAMSRLADAIDRVRGVQRPSKTHRKAQERADRLAALPRRRRGGRKMLYEFGSHEIERAVEDVLSVHPSASSPQIVSGVLHILGIADRSPLALERIHDAALRVRPPRPSPARTDPQPARSERSGAKSRKASSKAAGAKKTTKKSTKDAASTTPKRPGAKKAGAKDSATKKKPAAKERAAQKAPTEVTRSEPAVERAVADTGTKAVGGDETAAPGVKDIADLLGF